MDLIPVVIDAGSCNVRAGFGGENKWRISFPNMVGRPVCPPRPGCVYGKTYDPFVGEDAYSKRGVLAIKYPIEFGFISNMDDMELVLSFAMHDRLGICPREHPVLLSQAPFNPTNTREAVTQIMFEQFDVPAFSFQTSSLMALYSTGRSTGLVIELGGGVSNLSVIIDDHFVTNASSTFPVSGRFLTQYFKTDLESKQKGDIGRSLFWETLNDMKQSCCFVAQEFEKDIKNFGHYAQPCELPDGTFLTLDKERFRCTESVFNPNLFGIEMQGIQHEAYNAIMKGPDDLTAALLSNIVICGGSSLFPGLVTRLENELKGVNKTEHGINLIAPEEREYCVWRGGAEMAVDEGNWSHIWLSKTDYDEYGPSRIQTITL